MNKKLILILAMLLILLSSSVSAWEWDNVKEFEKGDLEYGKITIVNALGLGGDIAEYTLLENTDSCLVNCYAIGETILYDDSVLFNKFEFKDKKDNSIELNSNEIYIEEVEEYIEEIKKYKQICPEPKEEGDKIVCHSELINSYNVTKERKEWVIYDGSELIVGIYKWKLEGKKKPNENIDWVGESLGVKFDEWAWWDTDFTYYRQITFTGAIVGDEVANVTLDTTTLIEDGKVTADFETKMPCNHMTIVYQDTTELNSTVLFCNTTKSHVLFNIEANAGAGSTDYKLYYGGTQNKSGIEISSTNSGSFTDSEIRLNINDDKVVANGLLKDNYWGHYTGWGDALIIIDVDEEDVVGNDNSPTWTVVAGGSSDYFTMRSSASCGGGGGTNGFQYSTFYTKGDTFEVAMTDDTANFVGWETIIGRTENGNLTTYMGNITGEGSTGYCGWFEVGFSPITNLVTSGIVLGAETSSNDAPFFIRYDINSTNPNYNLSINDIKGWYNVQDNDTITLYCDIHWLKDNITQFSFIGESSTNNTEYEITLESENLTVSDAWRYELNCSDGTDETWVNSSEVVILDVIPSIVQSIPEDNLFTQSTSIAFECNATIDAGSGFIIDNITLITMNTDGTINTTYFEDVSGADISQDWGETLDEAEYNWSCKASSDNGYEVYTGNRTLTIDATSPEIEIAQGLNDSVIYSLPINISWYFNVSDANLDTCWYSTNEEPTNLSVTCNYNISTAFAIGGESNITYCVNDSIGFEECLFSSFTIYHITTNLTESADPVTEGQGLTLTLYLNMTNIPSTTSATLIWNGVNYGNGSKSITTNGYKFSNTFAVPDGVGSSTGASIDYNWSYHIPGFVQYNFTADTTTVYESNIGLCGNGYNITILNYTMFDETSRLYDLVNGTIEQDTYLYSLENTSLSWHHYYNFVNTSNATICVPDGMLNNSNFKLETTTRYWADGHVKEYHYLQNYNQSNYNNPKQINLYSLSESVATPYLVIYQDEYYLATEGAIIQPYRYYVGDGEYIAVEGGLTDDSGQTVLNLVSNEVTYRFYVRKDGELLFISSEYLAVCTDPLLMCQINLQETTNIEELINFSVPDNLAYVFDFDEDERTISFEFSTIDGTDTAINYSVILLDNYMNDTVCNEEVMSSGQTLTCVIPQTYKNTTYKVNINHDGDFMGNYYVSLSPESFTTFGYTGVFLGALAYMMIVLMATTSGVIAVVMGIVGLIFISLLGIFSGGSIIGLGSTILWFMVAGVIIIFKISGRRVN